MVDYERIANLDVRSMGFLTPPLSPSLRITGLNFLVFPLPPGWSRLTDSVAYTRFCLNVFLGKILWESFKKFAWYPYGCGPIRQIDDLHVNCRKTVVVRNSNIPPFEYDNMNKQSIINIVCNSLVRANKCRAVGFQINTLSEKNMLFILRQRGWDNWNVEKP